MKFNAILTFTHPHPSFTPSPPLLPPPCYYLNLSLSTPLPGQASMNFLLMARQVVNDSHFIKLREFEFVAISFASCSYHYLVRSEYEAKISIMVLLEACESLKKVFAPNVTYEARSARTHKSIIQKCLRTFIHLLNIHKWVILASLAFNAWHSWKFAMMVFVCWQGFGLWRSVIFLACAKTIFHWPTRTASVKALLVGFLRIFLAISSQFWHSSIAYTSLLKCSYSPSARANKLLILIRN